MKNLGVSIATFADLIESNFIYVDKTAFLYELVKNKGLYFLSRPRRFGKSLTCSTLEALFRGKKELFKGLAISLTDYDWKQYPVIHISFAAIAHKTSSELIENMTKVFIDIAKSYAIDIDQEAGPEYICFLLIQKLYEKHGPVAVIIDEYDKPILDHIGDSVMVEKMTRIMRSLYSIFKDNQVVSSLRFLFITGVSKFSKVSLFSELNNLEDLSLQDAMATLCGYTQQELEYNFKDYIVELAQKNILTYEQTLEKLKYWYNGFLFCRQGDRVYNPFSIINCLKVKNFTNYWFSSGTPKFMMIALNDAPPEKKDDLKKILLTLELQRISSSSLENLRVEVLYKNLLVLLLQTGYVNIKAYDDFADMYQLCYPNEEVRKSCTEQIFEELADIHVDTFALWIAKFRRALLNDDLDTFCTLMETFMRLLPFTIIVDREKSYQGSFFMICKLLGIKMLVEEATDIGIIDGVITTPGHVYVIEFKRDQTPDVALQQIIDRNYSFKYVVESDKPIVHVGINFDFEDGKQVALSWKREDNV